MSLKSLMTLFSLTWFFIGCSTAKQGIDKAENNCPSPPLSPTKFRVKQVGDFFENLKTLNIEVADDLITFQTQDYDFIFCDANETFITQRGNYKPEQKPARNYKEAIKELNNPSYQTIN